MDMRAKGENLSTLLKCMLQPQRRLIVVVSLLLLFMTFPEWVGVAIGAHLIITPYVACKEWGYILSPPEGGVEYKSGKTKLVPYPTKVDRSRQKLRKTALAIQRRKPFHLPLRLLGFQLTLK